MGFGDFSSICERTPIPLCPLVGPSSPITGSHFTQSQCYSRSIELANTIIFQGAAGFAHIITLIMLVIMIIHVRSKFTAVGTYNELGRRDSRSVRLLRRSTLNGISVMLEPWLIVMLQVARRLPLSSTYTPCSPSARSSSTAVLCHLDRRRTHTSLLCSAASLAPLAYA
jgi:hypothetical protein